MRDITRRSIDQLSAIVALPLAAYLLGRHGPKRSIDPQVSLSVLLRMLFAVLALSMLVMSSFVPVSLPVARLVTT